MSRMNGKAPAVNAGGRKKTNVARAPNRKTGPAKPPTRPAGDAGTADGACWLLDLTAAAWVTAIRGRVKELADEMGRIEYIVGHPHEGMNKLVLKTVLDLGAFGRLATAIESAEGELDHLLADGFSDVIPNLANACRVANAGLGLAAGAPGRKGGA